jgi:hypothetical protein
LLAATFAYNASFMWGFFNYVFAIGVSFLVFAAWIATDGKRSAFHLTGFTLAFTIIYFSHLFALAVLLAMIVCFELSQWWRSRDFSARNIAQRLATLAALCAPAVFFFVFLRPWGGGLNVQFNYLDTMAERFEAAIQFHFDAPAYVLTGALVVLIGIGVATKRITISPGMSLVLSMLAVCTLLAPEWALGGWGVHLRIPAVLGAITFASIDFQLTSRRLAMAITAILALFLFQAATLANDWRTIDARYSEFRQAENTIMPRARLLTVLDGDSLGWSSDQPYWHMAEFAIVGRDAFTPLQFATNGQHIIHVLAPMNRYAAASAQQGSPPDIDELDNLAAGNTAADEDIRDIVPYLRFFQCHFDQAVVVHGDGPLSHVPSMLRLRHTGTFYALYDVVPDRRCTQR